MPHHLRIRNTVQEADPGHQELSDKLVLGVHPLTQDRDEGHHVKLLALRHDVLEESVQQLGAVLDVLVGVGHHAGDGAEDVREEREDVVPRDLHHVVEALAGVVPHPVVRVAEAGEDGVDQVTRVNTSLASWGHVFEDVDT